MLLPAYSFHARGTSATSFVRRYGGPAPSDRRSVRGAGVTRSLSNEGRVQVRQCGLEQSGTLPDRRNTCRLAGGARGHPSQGGSADARVAGGRGPSRAERDSLHAAGVRSPRPAARTKWRASTARVLGERCRGAGPLAPDGVCAYNVCTLSREGYRRLKALQRRYLLEARALIAESQPEECAALLQVNLLSFDAH